MTQLVWTFFALLTGAAMGLGLTALAIETPPKFGVVEAGAWLTRPRIGAADADPYSRALLSAQGAVPLGAAEGVELTATVDSAGRRLSARCVYRIEGPVPPSRLWTLTAYRSDGQPVGGAGRRSGYTSAELVRNRPGNAEIRLSTEAAPGNWIALPEKGPFVLSLRLYDTQLSSNARAIDAASVPRIEQERCR